MTGFEFAKEFESIEEKMIVLYMDAVKSAYMMAGIDFESLTTEEKINAAVKLANRCR